MNDFRKELEALINSHGKENGSNTPDFILAQYLDNCLAAYDIAVSQRDSWYGVKHEPGQTVLDEATRAAIAHHAATGE